MIGVQEVMGHGALESERQLLRLCEPHPPPLVPAAVPTIASAAPSETSIALVSNGEILDAEEADIAVPAPKRKRKTSPMASSAIFCY